MPLFRRCLPFLLTCLFCLGTTGTTAAQSDDAGPVRVRYEMNSDDSFSIFADNGLLIPCYVKVEFSNLQNLAASVTLPFETVLPAQARKVELMRLSPVKGKSTHFNYSWIYVPGDPVNTVPDSDFPYQFPFEHSKKFKIVQGYNGKFTHYGQNQYAVDFNMPEGTPVCAARAGLVTEVKADSSVSGTTPDYNQHNNFIRIHHSDGTFGNYVHLKQNGAVVAPGDLVKAGQLIGYSGNTGYSSGPHLHFDVRVPTRRGETQSIPIMFMNYDGKAVVPLAGQYYYALHPGMSPFNVNLGRLLKNEDFHGYIAKAPANGKVDLRVEAIDDTYAVFLVNGSNAAIKALARFDLRNLQSSAGNPVSTTVPALSEIFITLLNSPDPLESYGYTSSLSWTR
jgi:murein DD-endopeptidase MepM/ murein hydrolase activator NlpD